MGMSLQSDERSKLIKIYDKKGEGFVNWDDLVSEHKYIHAVSFCVSMFIYIYMCTFTFYLRLWVVKILNIYTVKRVVSTCDNNGCTCGAHSVFSLASNTNLVPMMTSKQKLKR